MDEMSTRVQRPNFIYSRLLSKFRHVEDQLIKERTSKKDVQERYKMVNKLILKTANELVNEVAKEEEESIKVLNQMSRLMISEKKSKEEGEKLQDSLAAEQAIKAQLLDNIACLQGHVSQLEEEVKDNSQLLHDVTTAYTKLQHDLHEERARHNITKTEFTKNNKIIESLNNINNALEDKIRELQQALSAARAETDHLKVKLSNLKKRESDISETDDVLTIWQMQQRLEEEQAKSKATKTQLMQKNKTIASLEDGIRQLMEAESKAQEENNQLNQKVADLEKSLQSMQSNVVTTLSCPPNELEQRPEQGQTDYEAAKSQLAAKNKNKMRVSNRNSTGALEGGKNLQQASKQKNDGQTEWAFFKMLKHRLLPKQMKKLKTKETDETLRLQEVQQRLGEEQTKQKATKAQHLEDKLSQVPQALSLAQSKNDQLKEKLDHLEKKTSPGKNPNNHSEEDSTHFGIESAKPQDQESTAGDQKSNHTAEANSIQGTRDETCDGV